MPFSPVTALRMAEQVARRSGPDILDELSAALAGLVPHRAAAELAIYCVATPVHAVGEPEFAGAITSVELGALLAYVTAGQPWQGVAEIAGGRHFVLAVASDRAPSGALVVFVRQGTDELNAETVAVVQAVWDLVTSCHHQLVLTAEPAVLARSRATDQARAAAIAELSEAHTASMAGLLGVLRSRHLDDTSARSAAIDLALTALDDLRVNAERRRSTGGEEPAGQAFQRLADSLRPLLRHSPVALELDPPGNDRLVHSDVAHAARVTVRAVVLAMLQQDDVHRIRVGWQLDGGLLEARIRDDGPGELGGRADIGQIAERVRDQRGQFEVDAVPGWGMAVKVTLPVTPRHPAENPLAGLGERELEVLQRLALGHRNRTIAGQLHISESTVKFHVANILTKLGVGSRTEAAAVYHAAAG
jgi:DNA-binding CsgD family transcriptional regulator